MPRIFTQFILKPVTIFLLDGLGAFVTSSILFLVEWRFPEYFGMPPKILSLLSIIAFTFAAYSISCFLFLNKNWQLFLKTISIANLLYCCLTMGLVIYYHSILTTLGLTYFIAEIVFISALVFLEVQTLMHSNLKEGNRIGKNNVLKNIEQPI